MQHFNLIARANATFVWTLDFSQVVAAFPDLVTSNVRMQVKTYSTDASALMEWGPPGAAGSSTYDSVAKTVSFTAKQKAVAALAGPKYFDMRIENASDGDIVVAYGIMTFETGITNNIAGTEVVGATLPDTVVITLSETISEPGVESVTVSSLNFLIAEAEAAVVAAEAAAVEAEAAASAAAAIAMTTWGQWPTRTSFAAASILNAVIAVSVLGYSVAGDGPIATYVKLGSPPGSPKPWHVQTVDSAWWQLQAAQIDIRLFGAKTSASAATNSAAVQAAIDYASTFGGRVWVPAGTFNLTGTLAVTASIAIEGDARRLSTLAFDAGTGDCLTVIGTSASTRLNGFELRNIGFNGILRTGGRALYLKYMSSATIDDVWLQDPYNGLDLYCANNVDLTEIVVQQGRGSWGVYWHGSTADTSEPSAALSINTVVINMNHNGGDGLWWDGRARTLNCYNLTVLDAKNGVWIKDTGNSGPTSPAFGQFFNLATDGMSNRALQIDGGQQFFFQGCYLENTTFVGATDLEAVLVQSDASVTKTVLFVGCQIGNSAQNGITVTDAHDVTIQDCVFVPGSQSATNTYDCIALGGAAQHVRIGGCSIQGPLTISGTPTDFRYGVNVGASTFAVVIDDCDFYPVQTSPVGWFSTDEHSYVGRVVPPTAIVNGMAGKVAPSAITVSGSATLTAAQLLGGILQLAGTPGANTQTTPTAAAIVAALQGGFFNQGFDLRLINATNGVVTLAAGTGVSVGGNLSGVGTFAIASGASRLFTIVITNLTGGSEAVKIYG